ncbi:hypothetical protein [Motiliproteus sp. MSK22-1]|uniref:hypothetical protein n=1 Tax=Motiliproteus sp. MSK22-1 TaxID=1897630 RepID=UPI0009781E5F|nr:hypothetical protein [Motiliproteus sp. MSK22-1]OMH33621.1 hypothetical protein BGP75_11410 [Motiliproteus sp. MSK22-1]
MSSSPQQTQGEEKALESESPTLIETAVDVMVTTQRQLAQLLELFTLEVRYSGMMFGRALALAVIAALALFSVWGLLEAAILLGLIEMGWSWPIALATLALANMALLITAVWFIRHCLTAIGIDNTRQALGLDVRHEAATDETE